MEVLDVFVARGVEELMVFGPSLHRPRFAPEGADLDELGGTVSINRRKCSKRDPFPDLADHATHAADFPEVLSR